MKNARVTKLQWLLALAMLNAFGCQNLREHTAALRPQAKLKAMVGQSYWLGLSTLTGTASNQVAGEDDTVADQDLYFFQACLRTSAHEAARSDCINVFRSRDNHPIYFKAQTMSELRQELKSANHKSISALERSLQQIEQELLAEKRALEDNLHQHIAHVPTQDLAHQHDSEHLDALTALTKQQNLVSPFAGFKGAGIVILSGLGISKWLKFAARGRLLKVLLPTLVLSYSGIQVTYLSLDHRIKPLDKIIRQEVVTEMITAPVEDHTPYHQAFLTKTAQLNAQAVANQRQLKEEFHRSPPGDPEGAYSLLVNRYAELVSATSAYPTADGTLLQMAHELAQYLRHETHNHAVAKYCFPQQAGRQPQADQVSCFSLSS